MNVGQFLTNLKLRGQYYTTQRTFTDADLVDFANKQLQTVIAPKLIATRQNYFQTIKDYSISSASRRYRLPSRTIGSRVYRIQIIVGSQKYFIPQLTNKHQQDGPILGFYISQGQIILIGTIPAGTMRVFYPCRPISMYNGGTSSASISSVGGSTITTYTAPPGGTYFVVRQDAPYRIITPRLSMSGSTGTDLDCSDMTRFQVGDLLYQSSTNGINYVPLQQQLCDWLLQRTHMRVLQALGYAQQLSLAGSKLADVEKDCFAIISPRTQDEPKVINGMQLINWR